MEKLTLKIVKMEIAIKQVPRLAPKRKTLEFGMGILILICHLLKNIGFELVVYGYC